MVCEPAHGVLRAMSGEERSSQLLVPPRIISRQSHGLKVMAIGDVASATAGDLDLGQEPPFLDDDDVEVGRQGLGPYGGVDPRRAAAHHDQRLLLVVPLLLVGVVARGCADGGGDRRGGGEAAPPAPGEGEGGGAASGGEGGLETRRPWRHFVEEIGRAHV